MKKVILILATILTISIIYNACTVEPVQAVTTASLQGNPKNYITIEDAKALIAEAVKNALDTVNIGSTVFTGGNATQNVSIDGTGKNINWKYLNWNIESGYADRLVYYDRLTTYPDDFSNISFKREIGNRDWAISQSGNGAFVEYWMDSNSGTDNNNNLITSSGTGTYSQFWMTQKWMRFNQYRGLYNFPQLNTFNNDADALAYFDSLDENPSGAKLYVTPDGDVRAVNISSVKASFSRNASGVDEFRGYKKLKKYNKQ